MKMKIIKIYSENDFEILEYEIRNFEYDKDKKFRFIRKNTNIWWETLKPNEYLLGVDL